MTSFLLGLLSRAFGWIVGSIRKNPRGWLVGAAIAAVLVAVALIHHAGVVAGRRQVEEAAHTAQLARIHQQIELADRVEDSTSRVEAAAAAVEATQLAAQAPVRQRQATARARLTIVNDTAVSVDHRPPVAVPAPIVNALRIADTTIVVDSTTLVATRAHERSLIDDRAAVARQRDLQATRADTAEHLSPLSATPRCGRTCKTVAVVATLAGATALVVRFVRPRHAPPTP